MITPPSGDGVVIEHRVVLVRTRRSFYDMPNRPRFTLEQVRTEVALWGRVPIDIERTRAMLVDLQDLLTPKEARVELCQSCGYDQRHHPVCKDATSRGLPIREVAP